MRAYQYRGLSPQVERALFVYDRRKLAGESLNYDDMEIEAGVSSSAFSRAIAIRMAEEQLAKEQEIALSKSAGKKIDLVLRKRTRRLELEFETRVRNEARRIVNEMSIPNYLAVLKRVEGMLKFKRGIMTRAEYVKIIRCLHPDTGGHVSDENRGEAFRLFAQHEARLVDDREQADLKKVSTLPRTVEEMLARKKQHKRTPQNS